MKKTGISLIATASFVGILVACSGSNNGGSNDGGNSTTERPTPPPNPTREWTQANLQVFTSDEELGCPNPSVLHIQKDGTYRLTCGGQTPETGTLTPGELSEFSARANAIAKSDITQKECIEGVMGVQENTIDLSLNDKRKYRVYDLDLQSNGKECWLGDEDRSKRLLDYMTSLRQKYKPQSPATTTTTTTSSSTTTTTTFPDLP
jgi:hypothetical protein